MTSVSPLQSRTLHSFTLPGGGWPATRHVNIQRLKKPPTKFTETPSFSFTLKEKDEKDIINKDDSGSDEIIAVATTTKKPEAAKQKKKRKVVMEMGLTKEEEEKDMIEVMKGKRLHKKKQRKISTKHTSQNDYFLARPAGYGYRVTFTTS